MDYIGRQQVGNAYEITLPWHDFESFIKKNSNTFCNKIIAVYQGSILQHLANINSKGNYIWLLSLKQKKKEASLKSSLSEFDNYYYINGSYHISNMYRPDSYPIKEIQMPYTDFVIAAIAVVRSGNKAHFGEEKPRLRKEDIAFDSFIQRPSGLYIKKS